MKKITYILISAVLVWNCENFYGSMDDASAEDIEIVMINRSSKPVSISVSGADWIEPQDTIRLKPKNGLWKIREAKSENWNYEVLPLRYSVIQVNINNGEGLIYFDEASTLPYNPCGYSGKEVWDDRVQHRIIEFNDEICDTLMKRQERMKSFDIDLGVSPNQVIDSLCRLGSTEGYFTSVYPVAGIRDKVKVGAVVYSEAESIDKIRFQENLEYVPDSLSTENWDGTWYDCNNIYGYYDLSQLKLLGLTNFGCDFAELTGRESMEKFSGVVLTKTFVGKAVAMLDVEHPETFHKLLENSAEPACVIDQALYGNIMILLAEADCSHWNIHRYVDSKVVNPNEDGYYYYEKYLTPEISYGLITLNEDGEFQYQKGGAELAQLFKEGPDTSVQHLLSFRVSNLKDNSANIHIKGIY